MSSLISLSGRFQFSDENPNKGFDDFFGRLDTSLMACGAGKVLRFCPTPVAVHDDRDVDGGRRRRILLQGNSFHIFKPG